MTSAKTTFTIDDRSTNVVSLSGISLGMSIISPKGVPNKERLITTERQLREFAGDAHPSLGPSLYAAYRYLDQGASLWLSRGISADSKCAAALVRSQTKALPTGPVTSISDECLTVLGIKDGLSWSELPSYAFPSYLGNRVYTDPAILVNKAVSSGTQIQVNSFGGLEVGDKISAVLNPDLESLNDQFTGEGESLPFYTIKSLTDSEIIKETITLDGPITVLAGTEIKYDVAGTPTSYVPAIYVLEDANATATVVVNNSDLIAQDADVDFGGQAFSVISKQQITLPVKYVVTEEEITSSIVAQASVLVISTYEYFDRDAFLVYATPGADGNFISIGIEPSRNYDNAFFLVIYYKGAEVERYETTLEHFIDGFGNQMFLEDKVNGISKYVLVKLNSSNVDADGKYLLPKTTNYSVWLRDPEDVFLDTTVTITEDVLVGHQQIFISNAGDLAIGQRIKLFDPTDSKLGEEYKIQALSGLSITLDRKTTQSYEKNNLVRIYRFDPTFDDAPNGVTDGVKSFPVTKLDKSYPAAHVGDVLTISGITGTLVDTGTGFELGGTLGSPVTIGEMIQALRVLENPGRTPVNVICDGGIATPAYAQAVNDAVLKQVDCHGMISNPGELEDYPDAPQRIVAYRESLGLDTRMCSLFSGWVRKFDAINQVYVWECPAIYAANAQSFVTRTQTIFTPAAGNVNGQVVGLDVRYRFSEPERDYLVDNQVNPMKYDNGSITIWGNETLQKRPSPLQLRSVNFLILSLQVQVRSLNEYKLFDFNNESTWSALEGAVDALLRDDYKAKGGLYDYKVSVSGVITDSDVDGRRMPLFIGLQPTMDIQTIPTTIAVYNKSSDIQVTL